MADLRRPLTEGLTTPPAAPAEGADTSRQVAFLEGAASSTGARAMRTTAAAASGVPLNTRLHPDVANALKRASLTRKLDGVEPSSCRDILEEAVTPWLRRYGYLP